MRKKIIALCHTIIKKLAKSPDEVYPNLITSRPEVAFVCGDETYYKFTNMADMPILRAMEMMQISGLTEANFTQERLDKVFSDGIKLLDAHQYTALGVLLTTGKDRVNWALDVDAGYKLAACVYFDKDENPYKIDPEYCAKKIEKWKEHGGEAFFLQRILPIAFSSLTMSLRDMRTFLQNVEVKEKAAARALAFAQGVK